MTFAYICLVKRKKSLLKRMLCKKNYDDAYICIDFDGVIKYISSGVTRVILQERDEVIGKGDEVEIWRMPGVGLKTLHCIVEMMMEKIMAMKFLKGEWDIVRSLIFRDFFHHIPKVEMVMITVDDLNLDPDHVAEFMQMFPPLFSKEKPTGG